MLLPLILSLTGMFGLTTCDNYGKKIDVAGTRGEVYYKGGATESDARKLGDFLKKMAFWAMKNWQVYRWPGKMTTIR